MELSCTVYVLIFASFVALSSARAVNISNTWMLPEERFPVFYRYFRDRISWYEADAVCQFHHANLVTADSTSEYDAIRAYLKEMDIEDNVWIGLSKPSERPNFTWSDLRPLNSDGHWREAIPVADDPICVAMDPTADFLWKPLPCGGPQVASFICELAVPEWAQGPGGCLLTELPSLTVLYIPEQSAVELTSDCGLDGTKRISCKGGADREDILKQLTCAESLEDSDLEDERIILTTGKVPVTTDLATAKTTKSWIWTSNTVDIDYGLPTRQRRETDDTLSPAKEGTTKSYEPEEATTGSADKGDAAPDKHGAENAEYPSAINQGQLFSIIENGTMFDIIELNDTTTDSESKTTPEEPKTTQETIPPTPTPILRSPISINLTILISGTQVSTPTELPLEEQKKPKIATKKPYIPKKTIIKSKDKQSEKDIKYSNQLNITKEVEMFPVIKDPSIKLNRTFRKELPSMYGDNYPDIDSGTSKVINPSLNNELNDEHIEIKLSDEKKYDGNLTKTLFISTKRKRAENVVTATKNIDPKLDTLNNITETVDADPVESIDVKKDKPLSSEEKVDGIKNDETNTIDTFTETGDNENSTEPEFKQTDSVVEKRPNRKRQLNRPWKQKSFYSYFFTRVLG